MRYDYLKKIQLQLAMIPILLGTACTPPSVVGTDLFTEEAFVLDVIDTVTLRVSTVLVDSIDTYKPDRLLLGFHQDELLGKALAAPFFELGLDGWNEGRPDKNTTAYDSLTLVLEYDGYSAFDTNQVQTLFVHLLEEPIEPVDDNALYNNSSFAYEERPLGTLEFRPRPGSLGELEIRLSDGLGQDLFEKIRESDNVMESDAAFKSYFPGLVVLPDTTQNGAVLGFANSPQLRLYYRNISAFPAEQFSITFSSDPATDDELFNQIQGDRTYTLFAPLRTGRLNELSSKATGGVTALQGGTGILAKIEMPFLQDLLELNESFIVANAQLKIRPILERASDQFLLPETLEVYWVNEDHVVQVQNTTPAYRYTDPEFGRDIFYQINVQDFVEQQLKSQTTERMALMLSFREEDYDTSMNIIKMGSDQHPEAPMELRITILDLK